MHNLPAWRRSAFFSILHTRTVAKPWPLSASRNGDGDPVVLATQLLFLFPGHVPRWKGRCEVSRSYLDRMILPQRLNQGWKSTVRFRELGCPGGRGPLSLGFGDSVVLTGGDNRGSALRVPAKSLQRPLPTRPGLSASPSSHPST